MTDYEVEGAYTIGTSRADQTAQLQRNETW